VQLKGNNRVVAFDEGSSAHNTAPTSAACDTGASCERATDIAERSRQTFLGAAFVDAGFEGTHDLQENELEIRSRLQTAPTRRQVPRAGRNGDGIKTTQTRLLTTKARRH
jgi:hypothetical protein